VTAEEDDLSPPKGLTAIAPAVPVIMMTTAQANQGVFSTDDDDSEAALAVGAGAIERRFRGSHLIRSSRRNPAQPHVHKSQCTVYFIAP